MSLTHIAYAAISMPLCIWKVKRWKEWEVLAKEQGVQPIPDKILQHVGSSGLVHWLYMIGDTVVSRGISQAKFGGIYSPPNTPPLNGLLSFFPISTPHSMSLLHRTAT
eukprot:gene31312-6459_t